MYLTQVQVDDLLKVAAKNDGRCDRCHRIIKIYRYRVNAQLVTILRKMRDVVEQTGNNMVNFNVLDIPYRLGTQRTKLRLHGLIAKVKGQDGAPVANTWLLTKKAGDFLRGMPIPEKVVVFDNQVLGHDDKLITIHQVMQESGHEEKPISTAEAGVYSNVREPQKYQVHTALNTKNGQKYEIQIGRLQVGKPVTITGIRQLGTDEQVMHQTKIPYPDIAAFARTWKILEGTTND